MPGSVLLFQDSATDRLVAVADRSHIRTPEVGCLETRTVYSTVMRLPVCPIFIHENQFGPAIRAKKSQRPQLPSDSSQGPWISSTLFRMRDQLICSVVCLVESLRGINMICEPDDPVGTEPGLPSNANARGRIQFNSGLHGSQPGFPE